MSDPSLSTSSEDISQQSPTTLTAEPDPLSRRNIVATLLGAMGLAIVGCEQSANGSPDPIGVTLDPLAKGANFGWVNTITGAAANLRGITGNGSSSTATNAVVVLGYSQVGDGGGGVFIWKDGVDPDNGGTIIVPSPNASTPGCWKRVYTGALDVRWFGAKCDGTTNDADAVKRALDAVPSGGTVAISGMTAIGALTSGGAVGMLLTARSDVTIAGINGRSGFRALVKPTLGVDPHPNYVFLLKLYNCDRIQVRNLTFEIAGTPTPDQAGGFISLERCRDCVIADNYFHDVPGGFDYPIIPCVLTYSGFRNRFMDNLFLRCHWALVVGEGNRASDNVTELIEHGAIVSRNEFYDTRATPIAGTMEYSEIVDNIMEGATRSGIVIGGNTAMTNHTMLARNIIRNCTGGIQFDGISGKPISDMIIQDNQIENSTNPLTAISCHIGARLLIRGNLIRLTGDAGVVDDVGRGGIAVNSTVGAIVCDNLLYFDRVVRATDYLSVIGFANNSGPCDQIVVKGNVLRGFPGQGIWLERPADPASFQNVIIEGNSVVNCGKYGIRLFTSIYAGPQKTNVIISNNTVQGHTVADYCNDDASWNAIGSNNVFSTLPGIIDDNGQASRTISVMHDQTRMIRRTSPPTPNAPLPATQYWKAGDMVYNSAPTAGAPIGWVYLADNTWHPFATVA